MQMVYNMKKNLLVVCLFLLFALPSFAQDDSKETLTLKRDLAQERVIRIRAELELMKGQYRDGQEALKKVTQEFEKLNAEVKALPQEKAK